MIIKKQVNLYRRATQYSYRVGNELYSLALLLLFFCLHHAAADEGRKEASQAQVVPIPVA